MPDYSLPPITVFGYAMLTLFALGLGFAFVSIDLRTDPKKFAVAHPMLCAAGMLLMAVALALASQDEVKWWLM